MAGGRGVAIDITPSNLDWAVQGVIRSYKELSCSGYPFCRTTHGNSARTDIKESYSTVIQLSRVDVGMNRSAGGSTTRS